MLFNYNFDEVLQIAVRIEQNGLAFYQTAAAVLPAHKEWLLFLADQEKGHEAFYKKLREKFADQNAVTDSLMGDQTDLIEGYLNAMADTVVFRLAEDPRNRFSGNETVDQVIEDAVAREKDAVLFFTGIKESIEDEETRKEIDLIIREEMSHLVMLQQKKLEIAKTALEEVGEKVFDLIIVGAGPGGVAAAAEAISRGVDRRSVLVLEAAPRNGWSMRRLFPEQRIVTANYKGHGEAAVGVMKFRNMLKESAVKMLSETVGDFGIHVLYDFPVKKIRKDQGLFVIETPKDVFRAKNCILAVGIFGEPRTPDYEIPLSLKSKTVFDISKSVIENQDVLVVGGGDAAAVYAEHLVTAGNRVTLSCREPDLSAMGADARNKIKVLADQGKVHLLEGTDIEGAAADGERVKVVFKRGVPAKTYDRIVYALGGTSPLTSIELAEVKFENGFPALSEDFETNLDGLFLVGDLAAPGRHGAIVFALNSAEQVVRKLAESGRLETSKRTI